MQSVAPNIRYIGAEDDNLDLFEGQYPIPGGISYNSYLIDDERRAIIDAVDVRRCGDWLSAIGGALGSDGRPDFLIVQHMEPDHSGSINLLMARYPEMKLVCTAKAATMLRLYFEDTDFDDRIQTVADGDTLCLGRTSLRFFTAPMVHWPEVMMTLDESDGVLFSADAFGTFAMSSGPTGDAWDSEARRYYTNIVGRFGASVQTVMKKLTGLPFRAIAPLHGPVLTDNLARYWTLYDKWSRYEPEREGVLVAYASIYGGTAEAARRLGAMLEAEGAGDVTLIDLCRHHVSYAVAEAFRLSRMALCSVTYDGGLLPAMSDFLHHIESKRLCGRTVGLIENGSWAPVAARLMSDTLTRMKDITIASPTVTLHARLHTADHPTLAALARALAR
ncbi:MAG: FprA family A-type flavoprotein [Bacteroides sp.]|nr:FprA family A-type flavoprotein [Bacteroides sp.]MCM1094852.1 FprA family A-type flavoprotein [Terasakiella sp.]